MIAAARSETGHDMKFDEVQYTIDIGANWQLFKFEIS